MPFQKGQSGNPGGRPPKNRALTAILEQAGSKTVEIDGKRISGKRWMAEALWSIVTTSKVTLPDGKEWTVEPRDWLETVKWLYTHIDGPARNENGASDYPQPNITIQVAALDYRAAIAVLTPPAPGSVLDSDAPGEGEGLEHGPALGQEHDGRRD